MIEKFTTKGVQVAEIRSRETPQYWCSAEGSTQKEEMPFEGPIPSCVLSHRTQSFKVNLSRLLTPFPPAAMHF